MATNRQTWKTKEVKSLLGWLASQDGVYVEENVQLVRPTYKIKPNASLSDKDHTLLKQENSKHKDVK